MAEKYPTFKYWETVERLETFILIFCRAHREKNFRLYTDALDELIPFFFVMNHTNYARWASVHIRDMRSLPGSIENEFAAGKWVLSKTNKVFSGIPFDHAHEQENKAVKGSGSIIGITKNPTALRRWMLVGLEIARMINEFQQQFSQGESDD